MRAGCSAREGRRRGEVRKEVGENGELHACQQQQRAWPCPRKWSSGLPG